MNEKALVYRVFIVRTWKEKTVPDDRIMTRYKLEVPATGDSHLFSSPAMLLEALDSMLTDLMLPAQAAESPGQAPLRSARETEAVKC
jgi:hypothetical protein